MVPPFRRAFNAMFDAQRYARYVCDLERRVGGEVGFRVAETPVFCSPELAGACAQAAREIVAQLSEPARLQSMRAAVETRHPFARKAGALPNFAVVDFAIARDEHGALVPRLVELQGFPSLIAFEILQHDAWTRELEAVFPGAAWSSTFAPVDRATLLRLARETILSDCDPAEVVMLDVEPQRQKTYCDFLATEKMFGIEACDPRDLSVRGGRVYRRASDGRERRVARIYNRLVGDDLLDPRFALPFDLCDDLDLTWATHPAWFWIWSKASLPVLDHLCAPKARLLRDVEPAADVLAACVLKPLYSFAGSGVKIAPTAADVAAIPQEQRDGWCLQERIDYVPVLQTPEGDGVKVEIRVMLARPDGAREFVACINLARLSRGAMHGVDHNKDATWVGSSIALWRLDRDL